ncbi:MAG: hypothetical protein JW981_10680 [Anaerolineae bacterium]|nr:hypothetical protein [Anaerolineae bacterium]
MYRQIIGGFSLVIAIVLLVILIIKIQRDRKRQGSVWVWQEQRQQWQQERVLKSLETLDVALTEFVRAAFEGNENFLEERSSLLAQAANTASSIGDVELRKLVETLVARCQALYTARHKENHPEEEIDRLARQFSEAQGQVYRRIEYLLEKQVDPNP